MLGGGSGASGIQNDNTQSKATNSDEYAQISLNDMDDEIPF